MIFWGDVSKLGNLPALGKKNLLKSIIKLLCIKLKWEKPLWLKLASGFKVMGLTEKQILLQKAHAI